jgi:hypothetical protein
MKTGVIVYLSESESKKCKTDPEEAVKKMHMEADKVEVITGTTGHFDISDAWLALTTKGMQRIFCTIAHCTDTGELRLTDRKLRLCG